MKTLTSVAYLVGALLVVGCSGGDSSTEQPPGDPAQTVAPLKAASTRAIVDAIALRDQLQKSSNGDPSVVAPGHRLVKIAKIQARAVARMEELMNQAIADRNGTGSVSTKNTGGGSGGGSGGSGGGSGSGSGGSGSGADQSTGDNDVDGMDDDMNNMDDQLDQKDDDLNDVDPNDPMSMDNEDNPDNKDDNADPNSSAKPSGGSGGGKPSGSGGGSAKPSGGSGGGSSGAALQKLLDKLMKMLEKGSSSPGAAAAKNPPSAPSAKQVEADLTALYKLLNDPAFKKWQKFGQ